MKQDEAKLSTMLKLLLLTCVYLFSFPLHAQDPKPNSSNEPISDRPGLAFGASIIPVGVSQLEVGHFQRQTWWRANKNGSYSNMNSNELNSGLGYRYGVNPFLELSGGVNMLTQNTYDSEVKRKVYTSKNFFSQAFVRGRYLLLKDKFVFSKVSLIGQWNLHRFESTLNGEKIVTDHSADILLVTESPLSSHFKLTANVGIGGITVDNKQLIAVLNLDYSIQKNLHVFVESTRRHTAYMFGFIHDFGVYFLPAANLQLDFAFSKGKTSPCIGVRDVWFVNFGASWRFDTFD